MWFFVNLLDQVLVMLLHVFALVAALEVNIVHVLCFGTLITLTLSCHPGLLKGHWLPCEHAPKWSRAKNKSASEASWEWPGGIPPRSFLPQATLSSFRSPVSFFILSHLGACSQGSTDKTVGDYLWGTSIPSRGGGGGAEEGNSYRKGSIGVDHLNPTAKHSTARHLTLTSPN